MVQRPGLLGSLPLQQHVAWERGRVQFTPASLQTCQMLSLWPCTVLPCLRLGRHCSVLLPCFSHEGAAHPCGSIFFNTASFCTFQASSGVASARDVQP